MNPHHQASMQAEELLLLFLELFFTSWWCFFASSYKVDEKASSYKSDERASSCNSNERACSSKQLAECIQREKEGRCARAKYLPVENEEATVVLLCSRSLDGEQ
jgi:hypothetical protein